MQYNYSALDRPRLLEANEKDDEKKKNEGGVPRMLYGGTNVPDFSHTTNCITTNQDSLSRSLRPRDLSAIRHACTHIYRTLIPPSPQTLLSLTHTHSN